MKLILLPGNSRIHNEKWINDINLELKEFFDSSYIHVYQHWIKNLSFVSIEEELALLKEQDFHKPYLIFAKSIGVVIALYAIDRGFLTPDKCVFCGTALRYAQRKTFDIDDVLEKAKIPVLFIQQTQDPAGSFAALLSSFKKSNHSMHTFVEVEGNDHQYKNLDIIKEETRKFLNINESTDGSV